jgi:hypothetical protein
MPLQVSVGAAQDPQEHEPEHVLVPDDPQEVVQVSVLPAQQA